MFRYEVHLSLILQISGEILRRDMRNQLEKFVPGIIVLRRRPCKTSPSLEALVEDNGIPRIYTWGVCQKSERRERETGAKIFEKFLLTNIVLNDISFEGR